MTETPPEDRQPASPTPAVPPPSVSMQNTPNAERYVLEADAMRRQQLRSALLHGSGRNWRDHARTWPAVVVGVIVVAVIVAGLAVIAAKRTTEENQKKEQQQEQRQERQSTPSRTPSPSPSARPGIPTPTSSGTPSR